MRVFLACGMVFCSAVLMGADAQGTSSAPVPPANNGKDHELTCDEIKTKVHDLLKCFGDNIGDQTFKCTLMAVTPSKTANAFATQGSFPLAENAWYPIGQADVTQANWPVVQEATCAAITKHEQYRREWYSPAVGLLFTIPKDSGVAAGQYLILIYFDTKSLEYYYYKKNTDTAAEKHGKCDKIDDNRPWRDILTNAGVSLTPKASS